ncbi:MAG: ubiquinone biosynthesis protein [Myxococcota bacterium]|jgi:ubiquinone biosynthesis protein
MSGQTIQLRDLGRVQEIAAVLTRNGFGQVFSLLGVGSSLPSVADSEATTRPWARRLRQVLVELGPTFVKLGQVLSTRPDILPPDALVEFQSLQNKVPPMDISVVREILLEELGQPLESVFSEFDELPIGSASIAQVHRAVLVDGGEVAVKVQRKGISRTIRSDLHILYSLAALTEGRIQIPGFYTPSAIVQEFDAAITRELDFHQEAHSIEKFGNYFRDDPLVIAPEVHHRWCTGRILIMELMEGKPLRNAFGELRRSEAKRLAHQLMDATFKQVFEFGYFHGDPHPGNILLTPDGKLAFIDFGVMGMLTGGMQDTILNAFTSLVFRDAETLAMTVYRAGGVDDRIDLRAFRAELELKMVEYHGASLDDLADPATLVDVIQLAQRYRINLPAEYAVLARAVGLVEASIRALMPGMDIVSEVTPYAQRLIRQRFAPDRVAADAARFMVQMQGHMKELPTQFTQVLMDLEGGRLSFEMRDPEASLLRSEIRMAVQRMSLAFFASTVTMGALLFIAAWSPSPYEIPLIGLAGMALLVLGSVLFGTLGVHVLFANFLGPTAWRNRFVAVVRFLSWRRQG